jgi:hypothetical protein
MAAKVAGTWRVQSEIGIGDLTQVDTTALYAIGKKVKAFDTGSTGYGYGEFVYWGGGTSVVANSVVNFVGDGTTLLVAARGKGAVGLGLSTVVGTSFGWFQVLGKGVASCDTVAAGAACFIDGTSGRIDDAVVAGDCVLGMHTVTSDDTATCVVVMNAYPSTGDFDNA